MSNGCQNRPNEAVTQYGPTSLRLNNIQTYTQNERNIFI